MCAEYKAVHSAGS